MKYTMRKSGHEMATHRIKLDLTRWQLREIKESLKTLERNPKDWRDELTYMLWEGIARLNEMAEHERKF